MIGNPWIRGEEKNEKSSGSHQNIKVRDIKHRKHQSPSARMDIIDINHPFSSFFFLSFFWSRYSLQPARKPKIFHLLVTFRPFFEFLLLCALYSLHLLYFFFFIPFLLPLFLYNCFFRAHHQQVKIYKSCIFKGEKEGERKNLN